MLELRDLHVHFDVSRRRGERTIVRAVNGVSLAVAKGEAVGLVGESGSGKSTVGKAALRLVDATDGAVLLDGEDITRLRRSEQRPLRRKAQMIFQDPHSALNPRMTVLRSVAEPLILHSELRGEALWRRVAELLEIVGLERQFLYPLSARALGRAEAAGVHRPGDRARAGPAGAGRADLRPRRLGAGADPRVPEDASEGPGAHLPVHLAQPRGGALPSARGSR